MPDEKPTDETDVDSEVVDNVPSTPSSPVLGLVVVAVLLLVLYILFFSNFVSVLGLGTRVEAIFSSTAVLIVFYVVILIVSYSYKGQLEAAHEVAYSQHYAATDSIPRNFAKWILPVASILVVLLAQVIAVPEAESATVRYELAFATARALILLMIGMELSYFLQEHAPESRWPILVTASLILDFVSYFLLTAGHGAEPAANDEAVLTRALYVFLLGVASFLSSYYTVVQGRIADDVLGGDLGKVMAKESEVVPENRTGC